MNLKVVPPVERVFSANLFGWRVVFTRQRTAPQFSDGLVAAAWETLNTEGDWSYVSGVVTAHKSGIYCELLGFDRCRVWRGNVMRVVKSKALCDTIVAVLAETKPPVDESRAGLTDDDPIPLFLQRAPVRVF